LSHLAEALEAFMLAKLVPGSIAFTRGERRAVLIQLRGGWLRAYIPAALERLRVGDTNFPYRGGGVMVLPALLPAQFPIGGGAPVQL
ncbi:MAG: hypothetical protein QXI84_10970, partial [Thermofilaceae archaeon]